MRKLLPFFLLLALFGCRTDQEIISSINIVDRNGISETISSKERLSAFEKTDFLAPQPYQKVLRVYSRSKSGNVLAKLTSYHSNGQIKQYLETINSRAQGAYREWFANGQQKIEASVIGGIADLNTGAEESWLFDAVSTAWDEEGRLAATIRYEKGILEGQSIYYHPNGTVWKTIPYKKGKLEGTMKIALPGGGLFSTSEFRGGQRHGRSIRYWDLSHIAYLESYEEGKLLEGAYYDREGSLVAQIQKGSGKRAVFGKLGIDRIESYEDGQIHGSVDHFDEKGRRLRSYTVIKGEKEGEEIDYFEGQEQPKLLLTWHKGVLQGPIKSWYPSGQMECQREMCQNQKCGLLTAWYESGALMLVEEYNEDLLVKGEYFREGEKEAVSRVERGQGMATLFDSSGHLANRILYEQGKPVR